jgi:hypothetical protein
MTKQRLKDITTELREAPAYAPTYRVLVELSAAQEIERLRAVLKLAYDQWLDSSDDCTLAQRMAETINFGICTPDEPGGVQK